VSVRQGQEPAQACGVQEVAAREKKEGRPRAYRQDVGVAQARADAQALVVRAQPGERLVVERPYFGLPLRRPVDGFGLRAPPTKKRYPSVSQTRATTSMRGGTLRLLPRTWQKRQRPKFGESHFSPSFAGYGF
jgi:hypothetical protein